MNVSQRALEFLTSQPTWESFAIAVDELQNKDPDAAVAIYYRLGMLNELNAFAAREDAHISIPGAPGSMRAFANERSVAQLLASDLLKLSKQHGLQPIKVEQRIKSKWSIARKLHAGKIINDLIGVEFTFNEEDFESGAVKLFLTSLSSRMVISGYFSFPSCNLPQQIDLPIFIVNGSLNLSEVCISAQVKVRCENFHFPELASSYFQHKRCNIDSFNLTHSGYAARAEYFRSVEASGASMESMQQCLFEEIRAGVYFGDSFGPLKFNPHRAVEIIKRWKDSPVIT